MGEGGQATWRLALPEPRTRDLDTDQEGGPERVSTGPSLLDTPTSGLLGTTFFVLEPGCKAR